MNKVLIDEKFTEGGTNSAVELKKAEMTKIHNKISVPRPPLACEPEV